MKSHAKNKKVEEAAGRKGVPTSNHSRRSRTLSEDKTADSEIEDQDKEFIQEYEEI